MKMKIFVFLVIGTLIISHCKNTAAVKAAPVLDEESQETETVGEPRTEEETEKEEEEKKSRKEKASGKTETEETSAEAEESEEAEEEETADGEAYGADEQSSILVCILFCVAVICGGMIFRAFFKR